MNKNLINALAIILGILLLILGIVYLRTPAGSLPTYIPGFELASDKIHYKHAIGCIILGLGAFAFAWFKSKPSTEKK